MGEGRSQRRLVTEVELWRPSPSPVLSMCSASYFEQGPIQGICLCIPEQIGGPILWELKGEERETTQSQ